MIIVDKQYLSDDIAEKFFVCDLNKCKGACCVEGGEMGAPLEDAELPIIEDAFEAVKPYLREEGKKAIAEQGIYVFDDDGDFSTPTINGAECAYVIYDEKGTLQCGIEKAYLDGKTSFRKPISCHLYPIRITEYEEFEALNYDQWDICDAACSLGENLGVEIYKFLKTPLIRKYGEEWYQKLVERIENPTEK